jgi:hypothetical protein
LSGSSPCSGPTRRSAPPPPGTDQCQHGYGATGASRSSAVQLRRRLLSYPAAAQPRRVGSHKCPQPRHSCSPPGRSGSATTTAWPERISRSYHSASLVSIRIPLADPQRGQWGRPARASSSAASHSAWSPSRQWCPRAVQRQLGSVPSSLTRQPPGQAAPPLLPPRRPGLAGPAAAARRRFGSVDRSDSPSAP